MGTEPQQLMLDQVFQCQDLHINYRVRNEKENMELENISNTRNNAKINFYL